MSKTIRIKGFGGSDSNSGSPEETPEKKEKAPSLEEQLVDLIAQRYAPVQDITESTEQKSTLDLMDEMDGVADARKNMVHLAMTQAGFKLHYTGDSFVWLLQERSYI